MLDLSSLSQPAAGFLASLPGGPMAGGIAIFLVSLALSWIVLTALLNLAKRLVAHTETTLDDDLLAALQQPVMVFAIILSAHLAALYASPGVVIQGVSINEIFVMLYIFIAAFTLARVVDTMLVWYGKEIAPKTKSTIDDEIIPIIRKVSALAIYLICVMVVLGRLGIEIGPLIAGLGIAGLAVALALQETLSNLFAGFYILSDRPVKVGDYVQLDINTEGTVIEVGWRSTKIRTTGNNVIIIPNAKLAQSVIFNMSAPDEDVSQVIKIGVSYDSDPGKVRDALLAAARKVIARNKFASRNYEPIARFDCYLDSALQFKLIYRVTKYEERFGVLNDMNTAILREFRKRKIEIPFPIRTLYMRK
jgi:MscS family membrane protein